MRWARRYWLALAVLGLATVLVFAGQPVLAADGQPDINQTVPPATPRPTALAPTPTPKPNNTSNDNDTAPTPTPAAAGETAPTSGDPVTAPAGTTGSALTAVVQAVTLNVRQGPGTTFPVVGKLTQGGVVTVIGRNQAGDWWNVCCVPGSETPGWVSAQFASPNFSADQAAALPVVDGTTATAVATTAATTVATTTVATTRVTTTLVTTVTLIEGGIQGTADAVTLNVRSGPGTDTPVIAKLKQGAAVTVLGRNQAGDWLQICCLAGAQPNGWASAQYISPAFDATELDVVDAAAVAPAPPETPAAAETPAPAATVSASEPSATGASLAVAIVQQPPFAVQGKEIALVFTVKNTGATTATNVALRNDLPTQLGFVDATAADDGTIDQADSAVVVTWPSIPAGGSATATVRVMVAPDIANGTTFANLAAVTADDGASATAGITVGMPPSMLPEFW